MLQVWNEALPSGLRPSPGVVINQIVVGVAFLILSACALPVVDPLELPPTVAQAVPSDIDISEVNRDPDGCYFYTYAAELILIRDFKGQPICIKPQ